MLTDSKKQVPPNRSANRADSIGSGAARDALIGLAGLVIVCGLLLVGAAAMYQMVYGDRIYLGINAMGLDLGGKTPSQAQEQLESKFDRYANTPITIRDGSRQWKATPAEIGLRFDATRAVADSLGAGRSGNAVQRAIEQLGAYRQGRIIDVTFSVDEQQRNAFFARLARQIDQEVMDARLIVQPDLRIRVAASQPGRKLDTEQLGRMLEQQFASLSEKDIDLPVKELTPQIVESGVQEARAAGEKMLSAPLTVQHDGRRWILQPKQIEAIIVFTPERSGSGAVQLRAGLDQQKLQAFVDDIAKEVDARPLNARFSYSAGKLTPIRESSDGRKVEVHASLEAINTRIATDNRTVQLVVSPVKPAYSSQDSDKLAIRELIDTSSTTYAGSIPERRTNVELAARRLNGVVVGPGEIFSFNEQLGPATLESGFKTAWGIVMRDGNMQTVPSEAGGICQVSTTLFQSIFWVGYQIEERYWHLYWIPKYGKPPKGLQGLDSTVDAPYVDFKFKNNTPNPILIESKTANDNVTFSIYGTKPTWQVVVDPPKIEDVVKTSTEQVKEDDPTMEVGKTLWVEEAQDGFKSTIVRTVIDGDDRRVLKLVSTYKPSRNVIKVGTKGAKPGAGQPTPTPGPQTSPTPTPRPQPSPTPTPRPQSSPTPTPRPQATPTPPQTNR